MQLIPHDLNQRDIVQWLQHSWFMYRKAPYKYVDISENRSANGGFSVTCRSINGSGSRANTAEMYITWPRCGSVNVNDKYAVHVTRVPTKTYNRSYSYRCVTVEIPNKWDVMGFLGNANEQAVVATATGDEGEIVKALFFPNYPSMDEALEYLGNGSRISVAISPSIILCRGDSSGVLARVYYRGKGIGDLTTARQFVNGDLDPLIEAKIKKLLGAM